MNRNEYIAACNARNATIIEAINTGKTYASLATQYGLTRARIAQIAKASGISKRPSKAA